MKKFLTFVGLTYCALLALAATAQNPNWTMPGGYFQPSTDTYSPLPQSPNGVTDPLWAYQGEEGVYSSAGYTGPDGEWLFFNVDAYVYYKTGALHGELSVGSELKGG
jgi:hypothetical protein